MPGTKESSINIYGMNPAERLAGAMVRFCILRERTMTYFGKICDFCTGQYSRMVISGVEEKVFWARKGTVSGAELMRSLHRSEGNKKEGW